jgi:hypothetical protein
MAMGIRVAGAKRARGMKPAIWRQERWQQGWQAIDGDKGDGDGDSDDVGDGGGDEAGGRQREQG